MSNGSFEDYYKQLIGWTITAYREEEDEFGGDPMPVFTLTKPKFASLEMAVMCDPEGNGGDMTIRLSETQLEIRA